MKDKKDIKKIVSEKYGAMANESRSCCGSQRDVSEKIGYSKEDLASVPEGANLGLGCGNPVAMAELKEGDVVLDLGSGAGLDVFFASQKVGESGKVIGVDMTTEMIEKARKNAINSGATNVEFRQGEIEELPVDDNSIDVIISNCVINLSPDKPQVFRDAYRVLKPGGRIMVSDIVLNRELPEELKDNIEALVGCVAGAMKREEYLKTIQDAGFSDVEILGETSTDCIINPEDPVVSSIIKSVGSIEKLKGLASSIKVKAVKPEN